MNKILCLLLLISFTASAQSNISGKLTDNKNKPLRGISITLKNTYDGTTSDSTGNYSFTTTEKGSQILEATSSGYRSAEQGVDLSKSNITVNFILKEVVTELKAVVISAGAFEASDQKKTTVLTRSIL